MPLVSSPILPVDAHVGLYVRDPFVCERFYREALGLKLAYRHQSRRTPGLSCVFLSGHGLTLELLHDPARPAGERVDDALHLALAVPDFEGLLERIAAHGVALLEAPRTTGDGLRECRLHDPEGRMIELAQRRKPFRYPPLAALIFDLDGTLIDSEPNYYEADRLLLLPYGIDFTPEMKRPYVGGGNEPMMADLKRRFSLPATQAELLAEKNRLYLDLARRNTQVFPEMEALVRKAHAQGLKLAIASGSSPAVIEELLAVVGLLEFFPVRVSSEEVAHGKPAPDVFLEAARRLGVWPGETLVLEDAPFGAEAAIRGGFRLCAVPTLPEAPLPPVFRLADWLCENGMRDFRAAELWAEIERG